MNQSHSTIQLSSSSQPEIRQGRVALYMKSDRGEIYSIYLMYFVNGIRFGQTKVLIQVTRKASWKSDIDEIPFTENYPNGQKMIPKWLTSLNETLFQSSYQTLLALWVTPKQYYILFQTSINPDIFRSYWQTIPHFSRVYTKQYWHFQRVPSKWNYSRKFFQSSYHTIPTLSESYYQTTQTYLALVSNSIHTFTELLPSSSKHFLESFNWHKNRKKILEEKILN